MVRDLAASFGSIGWQSELVTKSGLVAESTGQGDVAIGKSLYARW
jgi:hypothetical protein